MVFYNPNKYADSGARVQLSKNVTANVTANATANASANVSANASKQALAAINPHDLDGLVIPRVVADKQYDVQTQLKKPLILQNKHDLGTSTDDLMAFYNPNKYADSGARVQLSKNVTANVTANATANASANVSANASANVSANASKQALA